jgi:integrase
MSGQSFMCMGLERGPDAMPLGDKTIKKLTRDGKRAVGLHPDQDGLYLQVTERGASWLQRITVKGKRRWMGLGDLSRVPLADAREAGAKARRLAKQGIDPIEQRNIQKSADAAPQFTLKLAANRYYDVHQGEWRSHKTRNIYRQTMRDYVVPVIGGKAVRSVTVAEILTIVQPLWAARKTTAGMRAVAWMARVFDATRGKDGGLPEDARNPAEWKRLKGDLGTPRKLRPVVHHPAMPWQEVPAFMARLRTIEGIIARTLEFTVLTAVRSGPVLMATWSQTDPDDGILWRIPGPREKSGYEHRVPLPDRAQEILCGIRPPNAQPDDLIFHGTKGRQRQQSDMNMLGLVKRMGLIDLTVHGFRSSFRDWVAEATQHDADIAEAALSHKFGATRAAYQRGDLLVKRRLLMADWDAYCAGV